MFSTLPPTAPVEMAMPQQAQLWMNGISWALVAIMLVLALIYWRRAGTPIGIFFLAGGALTTLNEPIVDVLGKCWFPAIGAWVLIKAWNFTIPLHMLPIYAWYVGGQAFVAYRVFKNGISSRGVFGLYLLFAIINIALEVPGLNMPQPMYSYFGEQPFVIAKFPLWWTFVNALMPLTIAGLVYRLGDILNGWRMLLIIPLCWMTAAATNGAIAAPVWVAINLQSGSLAISTAAGFVSLGLGLMVCFGVSLLVSRDSAFIAPRTVHA